MYRLLVRNKDQLGARPVDREKSVMMPEPTKFTGSWSELGPFLIQLKLKLTANATSYVYSTVLAGGLSITLVSYSVGSTVSSSLFPSLTAPVLIVS